MVYDMLIIGGGPAGYTAALYAARAGLSALVLERLGPGGQVALTNLIDNYPGLPDGVDGVSLGRAMERGARRFGAESVNAEVRTVDLRSDPKEAETTAGRFYGKTLVLATGAVPRTLGLTGEERLTGRGISYCAACDGMFFRGKTVAVAGGGNSAAGDALTLNRLAERVILIHRRDTLRAEKALVRQLEGAANVEFLWNTRITALLGTETLTGLTLESGGRERGLDCAGLFVSIGRMPASSLAAGQLELDEQGYILADETTKTAIPGVYAAGDVRTKALRQIVTATADGAMAVHEAQQYLQAP